MTKLNNIVIIACVFITVCSFIGMTVSTTERFVNLDVSVMGPNADFHEGYNNVSPATKENKDLYTKTAMSEIFDHLFAALIKWVTDTSRLQLPFDMTWYVPRTMTGTSLKSWQKRLWIEKLAEFGLEEEAFPWDIISKYSSFFNTYKGTVATFQTNSLSSGTTERELISKFGASMMEYFKKYKTMPIGQTRYNATLNIAANINPNISMDISKYSK